MGIATNEQVKTIRATGRGSDFFGNCDQCGKPCSDHHVLQTKRVYVRPDGLRYLSGGTGGAYGHRECLAEAFGPAVDQSTLKRQGNLLVAPQL